MNIAEKKHYRRRGLSDDNIRMLDVCLAHCTGCASNGACEIQRVVISTNGDDINARDDNENIENLGVVQWMKRDY